MPEVNGMLLPLLGRRFSLLSTVVLTLTVFSAIRAQDMEFGERIAVTASQPAKEVASSTWTQRMEKAQFSPRSLHACVYWSGHGVFVLGGFSSDHSHGDLADVWVLPANATDDVSVSQAWHQLSVDGVGFSPRHGHSVAIWEEGEDNKKTTSMVIAGGTGGGPPLAQGANLFGQHGGAFFGDFWKSSGLDVDSGIGWDLDSSQFPGRSGHVLVVLDHQDLVLIGGISGGIILNDLWCMGPKCEVKAEDWTTSTGCGTSWCRVAQQAPWDAREDAAAAVVPTMLRGQPTEAIVFGGGLGPSEAFSDVWFSTDGGMGWTRLTKAAQWSPRSGHAFAVSTESHVVLFGGTYGGSYMSDVWVSMDGGIGWKMLTSAAPWSPRASHCVVTTMRGMMLIGGFDGDKDLSDVWSVEFQTTDAAISIGASSLIIVAMVSFLHQ